MLTFARHTAASAPARSSVRLPVSTTSVSVPPATLSDRNAIERTSEPLYQGDDGVLQTLAEMEELALRDSRDPEIREQVQRLKGNTPAETVQNIYDFVHTTWKYKSDPEREEHLTAPIHLLRNCNRMLGCRHIDCDDFSMLLAAMLIAAGFDEVLFRVLAWRLPQFTHVYVIVRLPNVGFVPLDAVMREKGLFNEKQRHLHQRTLDYPVGTWLQRYDNKTNKSKTLADSLALVSTTLLPAPLSDNTQQLSDKTQQQSKWDMLKSLWKCNPNDTDFGAVAWDEMKKVVAGQKSIKDGGKEAAVRFCQANTDCYIQSQIKKIVLIGSGLLVGGAIVGAGTSYVIMRNKKGHG